MHRICLAFCLSGAALTNFGCAGRGPRTYRLTQHLLVPPGVADPAVTARTVPVDVAVTRRNCVVPGVDIELRRRGKFARVTVSRAALTGRPAGWLMTWTAALEAQGCLAAGDGLRLARWVAESLPLDPSTPLRLLDSPQRFQQDLGPENRIQSDGPIYREGTPADEPAIQSVKMRGQSMEVELSSPNLLGYETAWYAVRPKAAGRGFTIVPLYAERHIQGAVERRPAPTTNYFRFREEAAFYRFVFRGSHTIILLSAPTRAELDRTSQALTDGPAACGSLPAGTCVLLPSNVGANVMIAVTVNGREIALPPGASVRRAITEAGEAKPERVLSQLSLRKPYRDRLTPVEFSPDSAEILGITLLGGEEISWR
jgi:hypothetical protein